MKTTKRVISLLLAALMFIGLFAVVAIAEEIEDEDKYLEISTYCEETNRRHNPDTNRDLVVAHDYKCTEGLKEFYTLYYCNACGKPVKKFYSSIQKHTIVTIPAKQATCTETGLKAGSACCVCGKVEKAQEVTPYYHPDDNNDGYCDLCKAEIRYHCPYCNGAHEGGFWESIVKWFHSLLASFGLKLS